jgi:hypothetical protein
MYSGKNGGRGTCESGTCSTPVASPCLAVRAVQRWAVTHWWSVLWVGQRLSSRRIGMLAGHRRQREASLADWRAPRDYYYTHPPSRPTAHAACDSTRPGRPCVPGVVYRHASYPELTTKPIRRVSERRRRSGSMQLQHGGARFLSFPWHKHGRRTCTVEQPQDLRMCWTHRTIYEVRR